MLHNWSLLTWTFYSHATTWSIFPSFFNCQQTQQKKRTLLFYSRNLMDWCLMHCVPAALLVFRTFCIYPHFLYCTLQMTLLLQLNCFCSRMSTCRTARHQSYCKANIWNNLYDNAMFQEAAQKKQRSWPQKCAFACNCWFALPCFTSFVISEEHTHPCGHISSVCLWLDTMWLL